MNLGIVVAHYDKDGAIQPDLIEFCRRCVEKEWQVVFVSTRLSELSKTLLPDNITIITRPNIGYDFYSYKTGIAHLQTRHHLPDGKEKKLDRLCLINSSIRIHDTGRIVSILASESPYQIFGLTKSREHAPHIQSYFVCFNSEIYHSAEFRSWWDRLEPIDSREIVIDKYEIGMSTYFASCGYRLGAVYRPTLREKLIALYRAFRRGMLRSSPSLIFRPTRLNPTMFYWDAVFEKLSIVKYELIYRNPCNMDIEKYTSNVQQPEI